MAAVCHPCLRSYTGAVGNACRGMRSDYSLTLDGSIPYWNTLAVIGNQATVVDMQNPVPEINQYCT